MSIANKAFDIVIGKGFTTIFRIGKKTFTYCSNLKRFIFTLTLLLLTACNNFSLFTFGSQNEYLCSVLTDAVEDGINFLEKYLPVMVCRWASLCSMTEAVMYVSNPNTVNTNIPCEDCQHTLQVFKREFGEKMFNYSDFSCFLLNTVFETHTACRMLKEENGQIAAIKFFNRLFGQLKIANHACDCSNELFAEDSREEELDLFFQTISDFFSQYIFE